MQTGLKPDLRNYKNMEIVVLPEVAEVARLSTITPPRDRPRGSLFGREINFIPLIEVRKVATI
jgi:hypothetical protein